MSHFWFLNFDKKYPIFHGLVVLSWGVTVKETGHNDGYNGRITEDVVNAGSPMEMIGPASIEQTRVTLSKTLRILLYCQRTAAEL